MTLVGRDHRLGAAGAVGKRRRISNQKLPGGWRQLECGPVVGRKQAVVVPRAAVLVDQQRSVVGQAKDRDDTIDIDRRTRISTHL